MPASLTHRLLADERGHTLVELSVYLVLAVLAVGLALAAAIASQRGIAAWTRATTTTNALAGAASRLDADLRRAEAVAVTGATAWRLDLAGAPPVHYRSAEGRVLRNGRRLHGATVAMTLHLDPPATACQPGPCLARARLAVQPKPPAEGGSMSTLLPVEWHVLLPPGPWPDAP